MRSYLFAGAGALAYLACAPIALAQTATPPPTQQPRGGATPVRQVVVTAPAPGPAARPVGQAVATVTRDLFKDQPGVSIAEALDLVPGVSVIQGNGPRDVSISVRGSNDRQAFGVRNVQILEDGFALTQPDGLGRTDLVDPHAYGAIDVVEGPSSAFYGNYATGGAILFHTRAGRDVDGLEVGADFGGYGYFNDYAAVGGAGDRYEYSGFLSNVRGTGATSNSAYDTVTVDALATYALTARDRLTFKLIENDLDTDLSIRLSRNQFRLNPYQRDCAALQSAGCASVGLFTDGISGAKVAESAQDAGLGRHDRRTLFGARYEHDLDGRTTWRTTLTADDRDIDQPTSSSSYRGPYLSANLVSDLTHEGELFGVASTSLIGVHANYEDINSFVYNVAPGGNARLGALTQTIFGRQFNVGGRLREEVAITPVLTAVLGLGGEYTGLDADETNDAYTAPGASTRSRIAADRSFANVAPEASLQWKPKDTWTLHARVATGYGTPQATNLFTTPQGTFGNNTELRPQTNTGLDAGAEWRPNPYARLFLDGFYERFTNELVTQSAGVNLQSYTFNAPRSRRQGVEMGVDWRPLPEVLPGARLYAAYLHDDQTYTDYVERLSTGAFSRTFDRDGAHIPGVVPNFGDARAIYDQPTGRLEGVGGYLEAIGRDGYDLDNANLIKAPGYLILNAELHYDPPPGLGTLSRLSFYVEVQNLTGQTYVGSASNITDSLSASGVENGAGVLANATGSIYAGAPRTVFGGVRARFGGDR